MKCALQIRSRPDGYWFVLHRSCVWNVPSKLGYFQQYAYNFILPTLLCFCRIAYFIIQYDSMSSGLVLVVME